MCRVVNQDVTIKLPDERNEIIVGDAVCIDERLQKSQRRLSSVEMVAFAGITCW